MSPKHTELDYKEIFKELNRLRIDYIVVGGVAVNFHGVPRMTYDIDLMIHLRSDNILKLVDKLSQWGYRLKIPVNPADLADKRKRDSWIREKGMKAVNFYSETLPIGEIDLVIDSPISYDTLKRNAVKVVLERVKIPTVSIRDLIELKLRAGRKQDLADVEHLKLILKK